MGQVHGATSDHCLLLLAIFLSGNKKFLALAFGV